MKLKFSLLLLSAALFLSVFSQPYGNEWIDFNQTYYCFPVSQNGVYRITHSDLVSANIPLSLIDPRNIQIFGKGKEIAIFIEGESDGSFDPGDFIEFYAERNDGFADYPLYGSANYNANPYYSLFTDTLYYYLTWNNSLNNSRLFPENAINYSSFSATSFVWRTSVNYYSQLYYNGKTEIGGATDPSYHKTEGWFNTAIGLGSTIVRPVPTPSVFSAGPAASVHWRVLGQSNYSQLNPDHHLNVQFASLTFDTLYEGYEVVDKEFSVSPTSLGATNTNFTFRSINDLGSGADRSALSFIKVTYPHNLNLSNATSFEFSVGDQSGQSKSYLTFSSFGNAGQAYVMDISNSSRVLVTTSGSLHQVLIPNGGGEKQCILYSEGNTLPVNGIKLINGSGKFTDFTLEERSNAFVIITHNSLLSSADQYAFYKNSKGFGSLVINIDELYHQFIYGIKKHPYAIRKLSELMVNEWSEKPSYMFLVGKSIKANQHRKIAANFNMNLVPTFGNPASDMLFVSGFGQSNLTPHIPIGRLSAQNTGEVVLYLDKVKEFESNMSEKWMKNILHFAGGKSGSESDRFSNYLKLYEDILEDTAFGGHTYTFKKNSTAPIQISLSDSISSLINGGTSLLTFFGHASTTGGFDQNIDEPANYNNKGKYPLLVGNSCFTGDIHEAEGSSVSERFVIIKDRGVIAFLASVDLGFENRLFDYTRSFFKSLGQINYGGSLGEHVKYAVQQTELKGTSFPFRSVSLLMTLHGDPSLVLNSHQLPDYVLTSNQVRTTPEVVTTASDTFELSIDVFNYGKAINDSVTLEVVRFYPDLTSEIYKLKLASVKFHRTVKLKLPVDPSRGSGFNRLDITVDPSNLISELNEGNNFVTIDLFIKSGDLIPAMPYEFSIIPKMNPVLQASTGYAFEELQEYEFQLDTNDDFSNPIETYRVSSRGGVISWQPQMLKNMADSAVYFWRTGNTSGDVNSIWRKSSFQYIKDRRGWSQDHFHQFRKDNKIFVEMNENQRSFQFSPSVKRLTCQTVSTLSASSLGDVLYKLDADVQEYGGCGLGPAIHIAILDSLTFQPWGTPYQGQNPGNYFGQLNTEGNCGKPRVQNFFIFQAANATQLAGLKDMLVNKVPNGNYILAWTWVRNDFSKWDNIDPALRQVFINLGADTIDQIANDSLPYIFFVKKGEIGTAKELVGKKYNEFIFFSTDLINNSTYGNILSTRIGPASDWNSLQWNYSSLESPSSDSLSLLMQGLAKDGKIVMADRTFKQSQKEIDLSGVLSPVSAPFMDLNLFMSDNLNQSAPQIGKWQVYHEGVMDLALNSSEHFDFYNDTLNEGEKLNFSVSVKNISDYDADSILISYYIIDRNRRKIEMPYPRQRGLKADSSFVSSIEIGTLGLRGNNTLVIEVNPGLDQLEQNYFNNIGQLPFFVKGDNTNPILDVTFDGVHILDGDIVSARPEIAMQLTDDNEFLILDDTSDFRVYLTDPLGMERQKYFNTTSSDYTMIFIPAASGKNKAHIEYKPALPADGIYGLRVQARDRSSNESGSSDYRINFEVINRSTITNLLNYPNPFSTSTQFVFVLTGSRIPDNLQIQIMTISGKIVKTINMWELGPIRIGRNITNYAWDGRDEYGDKLANGVYLYRVNTRLNGQTIEQRNTSADKYFKQGFGKMVILR